MSSQALRQQFSSPGQPAGDGSLGPAELLGSPLNGLAFKIAEQNGEPIDVGQAAQF